MAPEAERRRKRATGEPEPAAAQANAQNLKAGELLRQARLEKNVTLEEISSAVHVRVGQLKAIEEDHIDALPGMTYAIGFVKSYANYLKLDAEDIAAKFRAQHGADQPKPIVQRSNEPILQSKMPDPMILGGAAAAVLVLIIGWAVFSGGDEVSDDIVSDIPPAPLLAEGTMLTPAPERPVVEPGSAPVPIPTGPLGALTPVRDIAGASPGAVSSESGVVVSPVPSPKPDIGPAPAPQPAQQQATADSPPEVINIKRGNSRVVLKATQTTWVQITDAGNRIVVKKILKPGDVFYVPEGANYKLVTTNAGGLDVMVDGKPRKLGDKGDIVRGVKLEPEFLNRKQSRQRSNPFRE